MIGGAAEVEGNSRIAYDMSSEGGADGTWTNDVKVYTPLGPGTTYPQAAGRYPQGAIYNPPGNTDPANAYFAYFIPTIDNSNGTWGGYGYGVNNLVTFVPPAPTQTNVTSGGDIWRLIPNAFTITQTGHAWMVDGNYLGPTTYTYTGQLIVDHGVFDSGLNDFVYEEYLMDALGSGDGINDIKIAFAPDGQIGYMCIMSNDSTDPQASNGYHPILWKTDDGGQSWGDPVHCLLGGYDGISVIKNYWSDTAILTCDVYAGGFDRDTVWYNMGFNVDMVVDGYGNPHLTGIIAIGAPTGWYPYPGKMATWHVYSTDGGQSFDADPLYDNYTLDATFGSGTNTITGTNRPYLSSTTDGKYLFFSWLDTQFEGVTTNSQPDIYCIAYDLDANAYSDVGNVTQYTQAWLQAYEGSQSQYVFAEVQGNDLIITVPFVYEQLDPADVTLPVTFWYLDGWTYTYDITGVNTKANSLLSRVSQNFPNPFKGNSTVYADVAGSCYLSLEIRNMTGQKVYERNLGYVSAGSHKITINSDKLTPGIYFYIVSADENEVTRKMIIR
jgi:hypothetical protein